MGSIESEPEASANRTQKRTPSKRSTQNRTSRAAAEGNAYQQQSAPRKVRRQTVVGDSSRSQNMQSAGITGQHSPRNIEQQQRRSRSSAQNNGSRRPAQRQGAHSAQRRPQQTKALAQQDAPQRKDSFARTAAATTPATKAIAFAADVKDQTIDTFTPRRGPAKSKSYAYGIYLAIIFAFQELVFHIASFGGIGLEIVYPLLFAISAGLLLGFGIQFARHKLALGLTIGLTVFTGVLVCAEAVYKSVFQTYFALFGVLGVAGQALDFMDIVISGIIGALLIIILVLVAPIVFIILGMRKNFLRVNKNLTFNFVTLAGSLVVHVLFMIALLIGGSGPQAPHTLYTDGFSVNDSVEKLGVTCTTYLSGRNTLTGNTGTGSLVDEGTTEDEEETDDTQAETQVVDYGSNVLEIDLNQIVSDSGNDSDVQTLVDYIANRTGTSKNEYTGMFEGKNLIWITAEGLDGCCINPTWTPTLYKMAHNGFVFNNYYSPLWYGSTSGGEWNNLCGTMTNNGDYISMETAGDVGLNMLFTAGRQATREGYYVTGWHNNSYTYYNRNNSFPNMGYDWHGTDQGYIPDTNENGDAYWPQSDVTLINESFSTYSGSQPFLCYYMTVSGHMTYDWSGNAMAYKNKEAVKALNLPYSESAQAYIACQMELDKAMETLLADLETAGIADDTLIVLAPDHVPYNNMDIVEEITGINQNTLDAYRNTLIIYSTSIEEPIEVDKYCMSLDILPTVSNLMGWDYDSRMLIGQDILSDSTQFVAFTDLSFISDKCKYNSSTKTCVDLQGNEIDLNNNTLGIDQSYIDNMRSRVYNYQTVSNLLFSTDFFKYVEPQMPAVSSSKQTDTDATDSTDDESAEEGSSD